MIFFPYFLFYPQGDLFAPRGEEERGGRGEGKGVRGGKGARRRGGEGKGRED